MDKFDKAFHPDEELRVPNEVKSKKVQEVNLLIHLFQVPRHYSQNLRPNQPQLIFENFSLCSLN